MSLSWLVSSLPRPKKNRRKTTAEIFPASAVANEKKNNTIQKQIAPDCVIPKSPDDNQERINEINKVSAQNNLTNTFSGTSNNELSLNVQVNSETPLPLNFKKADRLNWLALSLRRPKKILKKR